MQLNFPEITDENVEIARIAVTLNPLCTPLADINPPKCLLS